MFPLQDMFRESVRKFMQDTLAPQQVIYWFLLQSGFKRQHQEAFEKAGEPTREAWKAMGSQVAIIVVVVININININILPS